METHLKILERLLIVKKDSRGADHYTALWYGYQDVKEMFPELSQEEFKKEITYLRGQNYIEIDKGGSLTVTPDGLMHYLENKNKRRIGF